MNYEDFFQNYLQDIYARSAAEEDFSEVVFTERVCDFLVEHAVLEDYTLSAYKKKTLGIKIDAYNYSDETGALTLIISDFHNEPQSLTKTQISALFRRVAKFYQKSLNESFYQSMDESDLGFSLARDVNTFSDKIRKTKFLLLSTSLLSKRIEQIPENDIDGIPCQYDIWDLGRIQRIEESGKAREDIVVDFTKMYDRGLPCLPASAGSEVYESYLLVMPGKLIAELYDDYGERLLEQNVRTFLQFRGKVNKGMRNTIQNEPEMFFAYNNGITATAEEVISESQRSILRIRNLQIVNGGQTTAALFNSRHNSKLDISDVYVQVKLTVIPPDETENIVPRISEYANTQNKVSAADFFSNHPFHLRIEEISRRVWAPSSEGNIKETHWYYERVRGQYANAQTKLTKSEKKEFQILNPRKQMFTKTDLAKFMGSWECIPHQVSMGAQKNFVKFAEKIAKGWSKNDQTYNELYFKELIVKAIFFRTVDRFIMKQPWYGGYKANIVTYTVAKFSDLINESGKCLNFDGIWKTQMLPAEIEAFLVTLSEAVNDVIQETPEGITNVTEWCKKELCWTNVKKIDITLPENIEVKLVSGDERKQKVSDARKVQKIDDGINAQSYVINQGELFWKKLQAWSRKNKVFSFREASLLNVACQMQNKIPSEKQAALIVEIERKAIVEGFKK